MQNYTEPNRIQYFADILILTGLVLLCAMVFGVIGAYIGTLVFNVQYSQFTSLLLDSSQSSSAGFLKFYNAFSTFGAWMVSGFLFTKIRSFKVNTMWHFRMPPVRFIWFLLPVVFVCSVFISAYLLNINERLPFPENIRSAFDSLNSGELLQKMLAMNSNTDFVVNLLFIALIPALFEEVFFRGTLQPMLNGLFGNHHLGIWFCSLVFALIHLNILQFIPMTFLALVMGYLFHYTGSIFPNILIHFLNNTMAVTAYFYQNKYELAKKIVDDTYSPEMWMFIVFSLVLVTVFYFIIQQQKLNAGHE